MSTISTLTNVQNSLFVPSMGKLVNRRPAYRLPERPLEERILDKLRDKLHRVKAVIAEKRGKEAPKELEYKFTFAVLPDGEGLKGWNKEQKAMLDDNVRHMLHSKRAKFKRSMKGFWQYVRRRKFLLSTMAGEEPGC